MPKLDTAYMEQVSKGLSKVFNDALKSENEDYKKIATEVKANTISVDYAWIGDFPNMIEWTGERTLKDLKANTYTITRKKWESTIEVSRDVIEYDSLGIVKPRVQAMAESVREHYDEIVFGLLEANSACYDGKPFFATDHEVGSQTFSNSLSLALNQANFLSARQEMRGVSNEYGNPLRIRPSLLVVPPELEVEAIKILKAQTLSNGSSNITYGMCDYIVCDRLTDASAWYLFDTTRVLKPLVLQINRSVEFAGLDKPTDENVFMRDSFLYGIRTEDNAGYGMWQLALKSKP